MQSVCLVMCVAFAKTKTTSHCSCCVLFSCTQANICVCMCIPLITNTQKTGAANKNMYFHQHIHALTTRPHHHTVCICRCAYKANGTEMNNSYILHYSLGRRVFAMLTSFSIIIHHYSSLPKQKQIFLESFNPHCMGCSV